MKILSSILAIIGITMTVLTVYIYLDIVSNNLDKEPEYSAITQVVVDYVMEKRESV